MTTITRLVMSAIRYLLLFLDIIVYSLIDFFYDLFFAVSQIRLFSADSSGGNSLIETVANRIYALIGVYALFKITFILINMLVNPDSINDKQKGAGKITVRLVGMLALIIAVPWCFEFAYRVQDAVLKENIIGTVVLGIKPDDSNKNPSQIPVGSGTYLNPGSEVSNTIFSGFVSIDNNALKDPEAENPLDASNLSESACQDSLTAIDNIKNDGPSSLLGSIGDYYKGTNGDTFCINYQIVISLLAGGFGAYMFAVYCLDIGVRVAKMAFYELMAPIPIVSFMDGKKDGPFNNWLKSVISTYLDIFLRVLIINFVIFIIKEAVPDIMDMPVLNNYGFVTKNFAKIIIILGLLMFATQAPKLIKDLFGVKGDGADYGLSLGKKMAAAPAARAALAAGAVGVGAMAANTGKALFDVSKNVKDAKGAGGKVWAATKGLGNALVSPGAGAVSGMIRAGKAGAQKNATLGKTIGDQLQATTNKRDLRDYRAQAGYNIGKRLVDRGANFFGQDTIAKKEVKQRETGIEAIQSRISSYRQRATELAARVPSFSGTNGAERMGKIASLEYDKATKEYWVLDDNGKRTQKESLTAEEKEYRSYIDLANEEHQKLITAQKKKKTYDEAFDRMERKKKQG